MKRHLFSLLVVVALLSRLMAVSLQPADKYRLLGRVIDPDRRPIPGVEVRVSGNTSASFITDGEGYFRFPDLAAGLYELQIEMPGFERFQVTLRLQQDIREFLIELALAHPSEEITVRATLPEFPSELRLEPAELQRSQSDDLAESLRRQPGLSAIRRGQLNLEPTIRGLQETQVGMFVDGTRTFAAGPARMDSDISHVSPRMVQSVQVIKGPYALSWGSGTLSAIRVETFRPPFQDDGFDLHGQVGYRYGENAVSHDGYGRLWGSGDRFRFQLAYNRRQGNDYLAGDGQRVPGDYRSDDVRWDLGFKLSEEATLQYTGGYQEQNDIDYPGRILDATYFFTRNHSWELTWTRDGAFVSEVFAQFYTNRKDHLMNNDEKPTAFPMPGRTPPFGIRVDLPTESNTLGGNFFAGFNRGVWKGKLGFDFYNSDQAADRFISRRSNNVLLFEDIVWPAAGINDQGFYGQLIYASDRIEVGGTARLDWAQTSATIASEFFLANTTGDLDQNETNFSAAASLRYQMNDHWIVSAGLGRSVRTATALERYSDRFPSTKFQISAEFLGDPQIKPEESFEFDLGTEISVGAAFLDIGLFYRTIDNYITVSPDPDLPKRLPLSPPVVFRYINGSQATFYGTDAHLRRGFGEHLSGRATLSYVWGADDLLNEPLLGIPPLSGELAVELHTPDGANRLEVSASLVDQQSRVSLSRFERPTAGFAVFDIRGQARLFSDWLFRAGIENLGNRFYSEHLNALNPFTQQRIPEIGRNVFVALEYLF